MKYSLEDFHITSTDMDLELFTDDSYKASVNNCINEVMREYKRDNHKDFPKSKKMFIECYRSIIIITDKTADNRLIGIL